LHVYFQNYNSTKEGSLYSLSLWEKSIPEEVNRDFVLSTMKSGISFFHKIYQKFLVIQEIGWGSLVLPLELKILLSILAKQEILCYFLFLYYCFFTLFIGSIGIHFYNEVIDNGTTELTIL
jgi:NAD(P)H-quinone oxidoreductase subunit 5